LASSLPSTFSASPWEQLLFEGFLYRCLRMTRGQCGWLDLHYQGLSPFNTLPAFPGADPNAGAHLLPEAGA